MTMTRMRKTKMKCLLIMVDDKTWPFHCYGGVMRRMLAH